VTFAVGVAVGGTALVGAEVGISQPVADVEPLAQHHPVPQLWHAPPIHAAT
jgi:hypothetical protein